MSYNNRTGIILAAGLGTRLCNSKPSIKSKPLASVNNMTLLLRTINNHYEAGCERVIIVLGWQAEYIKSNIMTEYSGSVHLQFVLNSNYKLKNGISVLCARPYIEGEFLLTMADHILHDDIMRHIAYSHPPDGGATLCVDYKLDTIFDMDDATKVYVEKNSIRKIGKHIIRYNCVDTGVFIATDGLMSAINKVYEENGDASLSEGVQLLANQGLMHALDIGDCFWQDVDTPEMLEHAENLLRTQNRTLENDIRSITSKKA
jgi:1L-myo-inositol 1-phosphate cytidylyltransferase